MEVRPPKWRVAANILNKQSRTADKGWSSSLGVGQGVLITPRRKKLALLRNMNTCLGPGLIIWYDLSNERGTRACLGQKRGVYRVLVGKREGKRPLGRHRRIWKDNIKMDLQEVHYEGMDWIELAQDTERWRALVNAVMNLQVP